MPDNRIQHTHRITKQLEAASNAADRINAGDQPIDLSASLACQIISLCSDASRMELYAATCGQAESQTATLAATITIRKIARMAHAIIRDADPGDAPALDPILTPDTDIPQELTDACDAINPTSTTAYLNNAYQEE